MLFGGAGADEVFDMGPEWDLFEVIEMSGDFAASFRHFDSEVPISTSFIGFELARILELWPPMLLTNYALRLLILGLLVMGMFNLARANEPRLSSELSPTKFEIELK